MQKMKKCLHLFAANLFNKLYKKKCFFSFLSYIPIAWFKRFELEALLFLQHNWNQIEPICSQQWEVKKCWHNSQNVPTEIEYKLPSFGGITPNMSQREERENEGRKWGRNVASWTIWNSESLSSFEIFYAAFADRVALSYIFLMIFAYIFRKWGSFTFYSF